MQVYLISKFIKASYMYHAGAARSRNYIDEASAKFLKRILLLLQLKQNSGCYSSFHSFNNLFNEAGHIVSSITCTLNESFGCNEKLKF